MDQDPSPLDTLRQLKEWLDSGAITPDEFQTLKQKLLFADSSAVPSATPPSAAAAPAPVVPEPSIERLTPLFPIEVVAPQPPVESFISRPTPPAPPVQPPVPPVLPPGTAPVSAMPGSLPPSLPEHIVYTKPEPPLEPTTIAPVEMAPMLPPITHTAATSFSNEEEYVEEDAYTAPRKSPLMTIVIVAAVLALLALVGYLLMDGRGSERLTSTSRTDADSVAVSPEIGPQTEQIELPPVAAPETIRVAPVAPPVVAPVPVDTAATEAAVPAAPAAAEAPAVLSESAAKARVESIMQRYYADLQAAPFSASAFFAPQVERFYLMQSTTPAAINAELAKTHFPEFLEGQSSIRPGTLKVGTPVSDGSRVVTYIENSTAFRQSLQKRQQTAAQLRVRFDKDFKIVYLRQEKLLENNFEE